MSVPANLVKATSLEYFGILTQKQDVICALIHDDKRREAKIRLVTGNCEYKKLQAMMKKRSEKKETKKNMGISMIDQPDTQRGLSHPPNENTHTYTYWNRMVSYRPMEWMVVLWIPTMLLWVLLWNSFVYISINKYFRNWYDLFVQYEKRDVFIFEKNDLVDVVRVCGCCYPFVQK